MCARHFKAKAPQAEALVVQSTFMAMVQHANVSELPEPPSRFCPYCGQNAAAQVFLTTLQKAYIEHWAKAVTSIIRYERLRLPSQHLNDNPYLTYLPVEPSEVVPEIPAEPEDMEERMLMCCGEEQKLLSTWRDEFFCHFCHARHAW